MPIAPHNETTAPESPGRLSSEVVAWQVLVSLRCPNQQWLWILSTSRSRSRRSGVALDVPSSNQLLTRSPDSTPLPPPRESPSRYCISTPAGWGLLDSSDTWQTWDNRT